MARRKFIIVTGQSNATNVADAQSWEDLHPQVAIRNPNTRDSQLARAAQGALSDDYVPPGTQAGGQQTGIYGETGPASSYQLSNGRGSTLPAMRWLTSWRPTGLGRNLLTTEHTKYPHTGSIITGSTSAVINTTVRWQTARAAAVDSVDVGTETFNCAGHKLVNGERVMFPATGTGTRPVEVVANTPYYVRNVVAGVSFQLSTTPAGAILLISGAFAVGSLNVAWPVDIGTIVRRSTGVSYTGYVSAVPLPGMSITLDRPMTPAPEANEEINYEVIAEDASGDATNLIFKNQFGGLSDIGTAPYGDQFVQVRSNGSLPGKIHSPHFPVYPGQAVFFQPQNRDAASAVVIGLPSGITAGVNYFVTRREEAGRSVVVNSIDTGSNELNGGTHQLVSGERVQLVGATMPTCLTGSVNTTDIYFVLRVSSTLFQLSRTAFGNAIDFTSSPSGLSVKSVDSYSTFFIAATPGGAEIVFGADDPAAHTLMNVQILFRGSLSGLQLRCVSGTAQNVGLSRPLADVYYAQGVAYETTHKVQVSPAFPAPFTRGDKFVIEVPPINGTPVPFEKWALWLPYCPFEGWSFCGPLFLGAFSNTVGAAFMNGVNVQSKTEMKFYVSQHARANDSLYLDLTGGTGNIATGELTFLAPHGLATGDKVYFKGALPPAGLTLNTVDYFVTVISPTSFSVSATEGGATVIPGTPGTSGFWAAGRLTPPATPVGVLNGEPVYSTEVAGNAFFFSKTYGGTRYPGGSAETVTGLVHATDHEGKRNPHPVGFNYPSSGFVPGSYQPFDGFTGASTATVTIGETLGLLHHQHSGEVAYVMACGFSGSSLANREVDPAAQDYAGYGWWDGKQVLSWSPGDNGCFSMFEKLLDAANLAFAAQGDEGECVGIYWLQGETDASYADMAAQYANNLRRLRKSMRLAIKSRNLCSGLADDIPFIVPTIKTDTIWVYSATVNAAITEVAEEDDFSRSVDSTGTATSTDTVHYTGAGMDALGNKLFAAWKTIPSKEEIEGSQTLDVDISNLALAMIGETAKVFSLDPTVDQSAQAALCARFYDPALQMVLESGSYAFATRYAALTPITIDSLRTDYAYAYRLPPKITDPIEVLSPGAVAAGAVPAELTPYWRTPVLDAAVAGVSPAKFSIERDADNRRVLYTDIANAVVRYNVKIDATVQVPMQFKMAVARRLAALIAGPTLKGEAGAALGQRMEGLARLDAGTAAATDANRQQNKPRQHPMPWDR